MDQAAVDAKTVTTQASTISSHFLPPLAFGSTISTIFTVQSLDCPKQAAPKLTLSNLHSSLGYGRLSVKVLLLFTPG